MSRKVFVWAPLLEPEGTTTFSVSTVQFGDQYRQMAANGINPRSDSWPLTFTGDAQRTADIKAFLDWHAGWRPFVWTPPLGDPALWTCGTYTRQPLGAGLYTVTATFAEYFGA